MREKPDSAKTRYTGQPAARPVFSLRTGEPIVEFRQPAVQRLLAVAGFLLPNFQSLLTRQSLDLANNLPLPLQPLGPDGLVGTARSTNWLTWCVFLSETLGPL